MNVQNLKIGACKVYYKGVDLGLTKGGVTLNYSPELVKMTADLWGETPIDYALNGETWTVELKLAEHQLSSLAELFPAATLAGATDKRLEFGKNAGLRLRGLAGELILHPQYLDDTDATEDVVLSKAVSMGEINVEFNNEGQRIYVATFAALVDTTKSDGSWIGHIGDSTD